MSVPVQHFYDAEKTAQEISAGTGIVRYDNQPEPFIGPAVPTFRLPGQTPDLLVRLGSVDQQRYTIPANDYLDHWLYRKAAFDQEMLHPAKIDTTVHFGFNKTDMLDPERLNAVLYSEKIHPNTPITVTGFTDNIGGSGRHNQILSQQRSLEVKRMLVEHGVPDDLIETEGLGPKNPQADNKTALGRALNRRAVSDIHPDGPDGPEATQDNKQDKTEAQTDQVTEQIVSENKLEQEPNQ